MHKFTQKQIERAIYIFIILLLVAYGLWNTEISITLIRAFSEAMQIIITTSPEIIAPL